MVLMNCRWEYFWSDASIYEPFGAAIEYMVRGTVVIAREQAA